MLFCLQVQALTVQPAGEFSATAKMALGKGMVSLSCDTTFRGVVSASGAITVASVTFSGSNFLCGRIKALGLPWAGQADSDTQLTLKGMQVDIRAPLLGGKCGPVDVVAGWEKESSAANFHQIVLPPDCRLHGKMLTTPVIHVTP